MKRLSSMWASLGQAGFNATALRRLLAGLTPEEADRLLNELRAGGFTFSTHGESVPSYGYMVSTADSEEKMAAGTADVPKLIGYVDKHESKLAPSHRFLGAWVDGGDEYLDVSDWIEDYTDAEAAGYARNQLAIFDLVTKESRYMKPGGPKKASAEFYKIAAERGTTTTPPEGVSPRVYLFAGTDDLDHDGFLARLHELGDIARASKDDAES